MSSILITGADGHLGTAVSNRLLSETSDRLILFCRAGDQESRSRKVAMLGRLAENPRCSVVFGDLDSTAPFVSVPPGDISYIVHCAAATDFGIELDVARRVNVDGTLRMLDFARRCPELERFVYLSTLYVAGLRQGSVDERFFDDSAGFANHYEWSKWQAERSLETADDIPWQIFRIGTLLCDDDSGHVSQFNVVHNTLRLLYYGLLSVVPGEPGTRLYVTTTAAAVDTIRRQMTSGEVQRIYNVACSGQHAPTLGQVLDRVFHAFMRDPAFAKHGILKPLFCDRESFDTLVHSIDQFGGAMAQSLQSIAPFAPQLFSDKDVTVDTTAISDPSTGIGALIDATCSFLTENRWGKDKPEGRRCA